MAPGAAGRRLFPRKEMDGMDALILVWTDAPAALACVALGLGLFLPDLLPRRVLNRRPLERH